MIVKTKRLENSKVSRHEAGGEIKEVIINESLSPNTKSAIEICFRGERSSGIIELTKEEAKDLQKTLDSKLKLVKDIKVFRE